VVKSENYEVPYYTFLSSSVISSFFSETSLKYRLPLRCDTEININININISDVVVATFGKILGNFSPILPPSAAGVRLFRFRHEEHLVSGVGTF